MDVTVMGEAEQLVWQFFNMGRLISAMAFIGIILAIWLAMRVANMTRESSESNIVSKIFSSAFGLLILAGAFQQMTIGRSNWTNTAGFITEGGIDNCANPEFCQGFVDFVGSTGQSATPGVLGTAFLAVIAIMILSLIWGPKTN